MEFIFVESSVTYDTPENISGRSKYDEV
jgi:hypothetical protein